MISPRCSLLAALVVLSELTACTTGGVAGSPPPPPPPPQDFPPTKEGPIQPPPKGFPTQIHDSVYLPLDRKTAAPSNYGLYTVLLTRSANPKTIQVLAELFSTTGSAADAAIKRENLNLIVIPVKSTADAARTLAQSRKAPEAAAAELLSSYDFDQAALWIANACRADRGRAVVDACGSATPDGPLLVTTQRPLSNTVTPGERMLIVNLSRTPPAAIGEVIEAYRRQIVRADFADRGEIDGWRLTVLNHVLDAAQFLPGISKAYAGGK